MDKTKTARRKYAPSCPSPRGGARRGRVVHPFELRLKAVKLRLEEGFSVKLIAEQMRLNPCSIFEWIKRYQQHGEAGLRPLPRKSGYKGRLSGAIKERIIELKERHPSFGVKKISQWLKRVLMLPGSPETVRKTLHRERLIPRQRARIKRNPPKPRFFERTTPNQMWQTDIFSWRMGGRQVYLIGFIDDFSRYIVGLGVYGAQTSENVLEVYRRAVVEHGVPKELLSDNGRQYVAWRGKTKFQMELQKDRVHHVRSAPHHPMTLGKIERYWKTIWTEFLERAKFENFEEAQQRIALWVKYYNHKRPHQSLEGMCPADRFFGIQKELRSVIEKTIEQNVLDQAMGRSPAAPFYMVGRLGDQSVVIRSEKGQVKMLIDPEQTQQGENNGSEQAEEAECSTQRTGAGPGSALDLEREAPAAGTDQGDVDQRQRPEPVAVQSHVGDAQSIGAQGQGAAEGTGLESPSGKTPCPEGWADQQDGKVGEPAGENPATEAGEITQGGDDEPGSGASEGSGTVDRTGSERSDQREGSSRTIGSEPQNLLQVGEAGVELDDRRVESEASGPATDAERSADRAARGREAAAREEAASHGASSNHPPAPG
jgi:transposase InsO family protein